MKKYIYLLLALLLTVSFFSCTKPSETAPISGETDMSEIVYTDSSSLGFVIVGKDNGDISYNLYKIYPEEAVMLPLCPDPLCKHDSESCPFFDVNPTIRLDGDVAYYLRSRNDMKLFKTICRYNFYTDKSEVLYETEKNSGISSFRAYKKYIFFLKRYEVQIKRCLFTSCDTI